MNYLEIREKYEAVNKKALNECRDGKVRDVLRRGLVCCNNDALIGSRPILLTGINPSYNEYEPQDFIFKDTKDVGRSRFWTKKKIQFGPLVNDMAYMDLFPLRVSSQKEFEAIFKVENKLRAEFLSITQGAIEDLQPRLIIHANSDSQYYWGLSRRAEVNPWMGYKFRPLDISDVRELGFISEERLRRFPFYVIESDFVDSCKRINHERYKSTAIKGSVFVDYVMEERGELQKLMYNADEWQQIWLWVNKILGA